MLGLSLKGGLTLEITFYFEEGVISLSLEKELFHIFFPPKIE